ncbi:MAG: GAF domain-containing sensor histidine kinase [Pseudomonadota bacterium]
MENLQFSQNSEKLIELFKVGRLITSELESTRLFDVVVEQTNDLMGTQRCSIFLIDKNQQVLYPFASKDLTAAFKLPRGQGIAGWVYDQKSPLIVNDAYQDHRFDKQADMESGFCTYNILCIPLIGRNKDCLGTMQVINKHSGPFNDGDTDLLTFIASYVSIAIENSILYEHVRDLNRAKTKAISHLSHELKTPLALICSAFDRIETITCGMNHPKFAIPIQRGKRNLARLLDLQHKVDDIIGQTGANILKEGYLSMIEDIREFIDEAIEKTDSSPNEIVHQLVRRINTIFQVNPSKIEMICLKDFLKGLKDSIDLDQLGRDIRLKIDAENISIQMETSVLEKVCMGLVKNAIENTPDKGMIQLIASEKDNHIFIKIKDSGTGITRLNQKNIFKGFFHTQETDAYSSKRPYQFNAGGTGLDLLRIRVLAERFGFFIDVESSRCRYIPLDKDLCCGNSELCVYVDSAEACALSGGSSFNLIFPKTCSQDFYQQMA